MTEELDLVRTKVQPTKGRKRSKSSLTTETTLSSINDLPDTVLIEILCRLSCHKFVFQCKSVSKRWCTLITDPYFIGRFVSIQSYKKTPKICTLIDENGGEFPSNMSPSSFNMSMMNSHSHGLIGLHPVVVATYKDLVLWCATKYHRCHYYVCNAFTMQWVALPPTPTRYHKYSRVGFICDIPNYKCMKDNCEGHNTQLDAECKYKVVRILPPDEFADGEECDSFKLSVEIFSSETGEWAESVVSSPRPFDFGEFDDFSFVYNGRLYWPGDDLFFIGLGPFNFNNRTTTSSGYGIIDHELCFTVSEEPKETCVAVWYQGVFRGCVRMCSIDEDTDALYVWELKEEDGAAGNLCLSKQSVYSLDTNMYSGDTLACVVEAFDPNNEDILYLRADRDIIKCNIHTREWSRIVENNEVITDYYFPVELPWWPTAIPRLPQHSA